MAIVGKPPAVGEQVNIELSSQKIPGSIVGIREEAVGVKFDQSVDLGELLAGASRVTAFVLVLRDWTFVQSLGAGREALLQRRRA